MPPLSIVTSTDPEGGVVVRLAGEVDGDNAHEIREEVSGLLVGARTPSAIRLDMAGVTFIDSIGVGVLVACYHAAAASRVRLTVSSPTSYVHRILYISGLLGLFGSPARPPAEFVEAPL